MKYEFKGWIEEGEYGDDYDALLIDGEPLAQTFEENSITRKPVTVCYYICETEKTLEEAKEAYLKMVMGLEGEAEAEYSHAYSEVTGYLWTDEELKIGGHDLCEELKSYEGKYLILLVEVHSA